MKSVKSIDITKLASLLICLFLVSSCATLAGVDEPGSDLDPSFAEHGSTFPLDTYIKGKPDLDLRVQGGFYIWRVGNNWSVRIAKKIDRPRPVSPVGPVINGSITLEDAIAVDLRRQNLSQLNDVRQARDGLLFRFELRDDFGSDIEGFDFTVHPRGLDYCVVLDVLVDSMPNPGMVRLGSYLHIPDHLPLRICQRSFDDRIKQTPKPKPKK